MHNPTDGIDDFDELSRSVGEGDPVAVRVHFGGEPVALTASDGRRLREEKAPLVRQIERESGPLAVEDPPVGTEAAFTHGDHGKVNLEAIVGVHDNLTPSFDHFPGIRVRGAVSEPDIPVARRGAVAPLELEGERAWELEIDHRNREDPAGDNVDGIARRGRSTRAGAMMIRAPATIAAPAATPGAAFAIAVGPIAVPAAVAVAVTAVTAAVAIFPPTPATASKNHDPGTHPRRSCRIRRR
jgi:hypothetical protein